MKYIFYLLFIVIFIWFPKSSLPFEIPKVIFFGWFVKLLALSFALSFIKKRSNWKLNKKIAIPIIVFFIWSLVVSIFGNNFTKSIYGNHYRNDGLLTYLNLLGFSFLVSYFWKEEYKEVFKKIFGISGLILSLIAIFEIVSKKFGLGTAATFGNPVFLAGYLLTSLPFTRILNRYAFIIQVAAILLINATAASVILVVYLGYLSYLKFKKNIRYVFLGLSIVVSFILSFLWVRDYYRENRKVLIYQGRYRIYRNLAEATIKKPIFGYGFSNVDYAFESIVWPVKIDRDIYLDKAHSEILEVLVTTGFVGLAIYIVFLTNLFKSQIKKLKKTKDVKWEETIMVALVIYILHSQTNVMSITQQIIFYFIVGLNLI